MNSLIFKEIDNDTEIEDSIEFLEKQKYSINRAIWEWEFGKGNHSILACIKDNSKIIGTQMMIPLNLRIGKNDVVRTAKSENSHIDKDYRGLSLFEKLYFFAVDKSVDRGIELLWGFTPAVKVFENKLKFHVFIDKTYYSIIIIKPQYNSFYLKNNILKNIMFLKYKLYSLFSPSKDIDDKLIKANRLVDKNDLNDFFDQISKGDKNLIHLDYSIDYLDWRVYNNPNQDYITKFFYKDNKLEGFYIASIKNEVVFLSELLSLNADNVNFIYDDLICELSQINVKSIQYLGNKFNKLNNEIFKFLRAKGALERLNKDFVFVLKQIPEIDNKHDNLYQIENWYYNGLWTEGFSF